jgi:hypothetical protein
METDPHDELPRGKIIVSRLMILTNQCPSMRVDSYLISWKWALSIYEVQYFCLHKCT